MGNCGGHEVEVDLPAVRIIMLPSRCTAKHQPPDLGVIANEKVR